MKKIAIIAITLMMVFGCYAQKVKRTCCSCYNFFSDEEIQFIRDSVISYNSDKEGESWIKTVISEYSYDNRFKIEEHQVFIIDPGETEPRPVSRYAFEYRKEERQMVRLGFLWDRDLNTWQEANLAKYHYDSSFAISGRIDLNWNQSSNEWVFNYDNLFNYENQGEEYNYQRKKWYPDLDVWMNDKKTICVQDDDQKTCMSYEWSRELSEWLFHTRMFYHYNEDKILIKREVEEFNPEQNSWVSSRIYYYLYDHLDREVEWLTHGWNEKGERNNRGRHLYAYDEHGNRIETLRFRWDSESQAWAVSGKQIEYWTNLVKSNRDEINPGEIKIYPNPFEEFATLEFVDYKNIKRIEMIDMFGRKVRIFQEVNQPTLTLDRVNLQSGLYLLQVYTTSGTQTIRVIIE